MFLKYRPVQVQDLAECLYCIRDHFTYSDKNRPQLLHLWQELIKSGATSAMVMEDIEATPGSRIVWFCIKVFVPDDYVSYLKTNAPPFVGKHILDLWCAGQSPLLTLPQIREANSPGGSGVNILVLNSGSPPRIANTDLGHTILGKVVEFTPLCAGGYQLNELLIEVYNDLTYAWVEGTGMSLRTDYTDFYRQSGNTPTAGSPCPRLYGVTKSEARARPGTAFSAVFPLDMPRYFFTPAEQELLQWALFGDTDQYLATALGVSLVAIKKPWASIYSRVEFITPGFLEDGREATDQRGTEKRRILLGYLRHHLEEVRPLLQNKTKS